MFFGYLSDLQKQEERGELLQPLIFVLLVLCSILLYFKVSLMDPGFVKPEEEAKVNPFMNRTEWRNCKVYRLFYFSTFSPLKSETVSVVLA